METTTFIEAKMAFIRDFMNSTRPASDLEEFIKAFDTCNVGHGEIVSSEPFDIHDILTDIPVKKTRRGGVRKQVVIHDGTKLNVHPASKMVKASFFDRDTYYGSISAAAKALGVSVVAVSKALKRGGLVNGHKVELANANDLRKPVTQQSRPTCERDANENDTKQ